MDLYQITYITSSEEETATVKKEIEKLGGKIISENSLGYKKFSYPIGKLQAGSYMTYVFELLPENIKNLDKALSLDSEVIRFLIVKKRVEKKEAEAPKEVAKIKEEAAMLPEETAQEPVEEVVEEKEEKPKKKKETKKTEEKVETAEEVAEEIEELKEEAEDTDDRLKKLEEKLDQLLKD